MLRVMLVPVAGLAALVLAYFAILKVAEDDPRYDVSKLAETAMITAYDIRYGWGARMGEGSGYTLGTLDGTWQSMLKLTPQAINVSLFRPYLWEVRNPLMLLSSIEGFALLMLTFFVIIRVKGKILKYFLKPDALFCLIFALIFAFAVGVSTYNFGTLSRYKIPLMPYYCLGLGLIYYYWNRDKKLDTLEDVE
jgi:hypothetical protein